MRQGQLDNTARTMNAGFSLVELMVAMTLGLVLTAGMFAVFAGNQRSSKLNTEMANMQESIRFALNAVADDVRMAGYQGCMDLNGGTVDIIANDAPSANLQRTAISGAIVQADASWAPAPELGTGLGVFSPPTKITPRIGTHTLAVQFARTPGSRLAAPQMVSSVPDATAPLVLSRAIDVKKGDLALISTCEAGEIFRVSGTAKPNDGTMQLLHAASHNTRASFQRSYGVAANNEAVLNSSLAQTRVMPFTTRVYFVADSGENKPDGTPVYGLYQQTMPFDEDTNPPVMLVEGVENMRVLFGIGAAKGQLRYVTADNAAYDPTQIRSVRIGLLMSSFDQLLDTSDTNTYQLAGQSIDISSTDATSAAYADDKRLRLAFNTTVSVRNRRAQE